MAKIVFLSDFGAKGSGYLNIAVPLCNGLTARGHEVKAIGLMYQGEPHNHPFTIIPARDFRDVSAMMNNLNLLWPFDVLVVAMDIPIQEMILKDSKKLGLKHIAITPLESDPLCFSWANVLSNADKVFFISQHATDEAIKAGLEAEHILVGIDTVSWRLPLPDEKQQVRKTFNIPDDAFVILTVADNQERKNLSKSFEIVEKRIKYRDCFTGIHYYALVRFCLRLQSNTVACHSGRNFVVVLPMSDISYHSQNELQEK